MSGLTSTATSNSSNVRRPGARIVSNPQRVARQTRLKNPPPSGLAQPLRVGTTRAPERGCVAETSRSNIRRPSRGKFLNASGQSKLLRLIPLRGTQARSVEKCFASAQRLISAQPAVAARVF